MPPEDADDQFLDEPSHPSLALGTHDAAGRRREDRTKIESPSAQKKTPPPEEARAPRPPPIPRGNTEEPERLNSVLGSYRVLELLGKGGMGYVYRAEHVKLGREVALKLLRTDYARRRDAVARFFQEARTVNRVRHRNIVDVTDFVELDDGTTFIIMEFLRGQSLGKWARTGIDLPRALAVLVQICDGLGAAHQVGVVHRDLKPDNIIVIPTSDGAELVKLLDFGVAKLLNRDDEDVGFQTAAGSVIGTPAYMSPEQAGGMVIDARSDIYSLGAIMYELFCGQPMFRGRSFGEYVRKHLTEMPVPPRATAAGSTMDPILEMLIMRCLEKDPNQRFGQILELRDALLGMLGGMETHPPGFANLTASGLRPPPQHVLPPMANTILPQVPMMRLPTPASSSQISGANPSLHYGYSNYSQVAAPPSQTTPWWVWFVGGALAVGLGVSAAVWYAGRSHDNELVQPAAGTPTQTQPTTAQPIEQPGLLSTRPRHVELRFDSLPSGGVYAEGKSAELCRTPCAFNVDLDDGGSKLRRSFVVRSAGYRDGIVHVDLAGATREFRVSLEQLAPTSDGSIARPVATDAPSPAEPIPTKTTKTTKTRPGKIVKPRDKVETKVETKPDPVETKPETKADPVETKPEPVIKKPEPVKKPDKIDPSDTLDPFRRKR